MALQPKHASCSLDRAFLVPVADSWAVRSAPVASLVRADSVGSRISAPDLASANRYAVDRDFDLTFLFSFRVFYR